MAGVFALLKSQGAQKEGSSADLMLYPRSREYTMRISCFCSLLSTVNVGDAEEEATNRISAFYS